ncbi:MAG: hypothetical protein ACTSRW_07840 [Candidatus Helarchaeota archaeon]
MKEVPLEQLATWYADANKKKLGSFKKEAVKRVSKVEKLLDETTKLCIMLKNRIPNAEDVSSKSALKLAEKIIRRIEQLDLPDRENINYKDLADFKLAIERFLRDVFDSSRRLVKKLDRSYYQDLREINYLLTEINQLQLKIKNIVEKKYLGIRVIESTLSRIERLESLIEQILDNKKEQREIQARIESAEKKLNSLQEEYSILKKDPAIVKIEEKEKLITSLKSEVVSKLGAFRKGFKKLHRLASNGSFSLSAGAYKNLVEYSERPFETFISEDENFPKLRSVLANLNDALKSKKLKLKEKRIQRKIDEILSSKKIFEVPKRLKETEESLKELELKLEERGIATKLKQSKKSVEEQMLQVSNAKLELRKIEEEQERLQNRIVELKSKIEKDIKDTANQIVTINFSKN